METKDKLEIIIQLRKQRRTYQGIGVVLGISKQRVHQIYKDYRTLKPEKSRKIKENNGDRCEICGTNKNLQIHHIDGNWRNNSYDNIMVLCHKHHGIIGSKRKKQLGIKNDSVRELYRESVCEQCGKSFYYRISGGKGRFCSRECCTKFQKENRKYKSDKEMWRVNARKWYQRHKDDVGFMEKTRERNRRWYAKSKLSTD